MEKHGYDVSYISNVDTHADPRGLLRAKGFISVGHDEHWSLEMYDNAIKARDAGVSLTFFGGNSVLCVVPMLPSSDGTPNRNILREDRNGEGAITLEEFIGSPKGRNVPALTKRFKNLDSNGDDKLTPDELK